MFSESTPLRVVVAGGQGLIATSIIEGFFRSKIHTFAITALSRREVSNPIPAISPHSICYTTISYTSHNDLVAVLRNADVLVSAVNYMLAPKIDTLLLNAAIEANVPRFFPSDYDGDRSHPHLKATAFAVYAEYFAFMETLEMAAANGKISWTIISPAEFLNGDVEVMDWLGFDIGRREATLYDDGIHPTTGCTVEFLGDVFAKVVGDNSKDTTNRRILVAEFGYSGLEVLNLMEEIMNEKWTIVKNVSSQESVRNANEMLRDGDLKGAYLAHVMRLNYDGEGVANLVDGLKYGESVLKRKKLREVIEAAVKRKPREQIET